MNQNRRQLTRNNMMVSLNLAVFLLLFAGVSGSCPSGWLRAGDYCYWLSTHVVSFEDAQAVCATEDASLVSLSTSLDLNASLAVLASSPKIRQAWTCLRYDPTLQSWAWLDGTPYSVSSVPWWGGLEPSLRSGTIEACAKLSPAIHRLHRDSCSAYAAPLCRRSAYQREICREEAGWHAIGKNCYRTFSDRQTWWDAQQTCRSHSATLLPLPLSDAVRAVIQQSVVCDTSENDVWISSPNVTAMASSTQAPGASPATASAQCNYVSVQYNRILVQGSCLEERKFICVKPPGSCAEGWLSREGRCYLSPSSSLPWLAAGKRCMDQGAQLLVISDAAEQQFIKTQMISGNFPQQFWMGMSDTDHDGQEVWMDGSSVSVPFARWDPGFPSNTPNSVDCGIITLEENDARWSVGYCYTSRPYVCEMSVSDDVRNVTHTAGCDAGWRLQEFQGACYQLGTSKDYTEASAFCSAAGGTLATVHSPQDQAGLAALIPDVSQAWIGLRRDNLTKQFVWADDGTTPTMTNWLPGEPNNAGGSEDCVQMVGAARRDHAGAWSDNDCNQRSDFICQKPTSASVTTPNPATLVTGPWSWRCGEGWLLSNTLSTCYLLVTDVTIPWSSARAQCRRRGADLVSITSHREQTLVEAMVRSAGLAQGGQAWSGVWIGATDNTVEGVGVERRFPLPLSPLVSRVPIRVHCVAVTGQPDNRGLFGEEQDCAIAVPAATLMWDDRNCGEAHNYLCEKTAAPASTAPPVAGTSTPPTGQCRGWAMLSGDYSVTDSMLVASSSSDADHSPAKSRIFPGNTAAWMSSTSDSAPWLGVHFESLVTVRGVTTTGGLGQQQAWVTSYKLKYRFDSTAPLYWYTNPPGTDPKVLSGNNDSSTPVTNTLGLPFLARQVYIYPSLWVGPAPSLRWELLGCLEDDCSPDYAVSGPLVVAGDNITASSVSDTAHSAASARLHALTAGGQLSCWRPATSGSSQWIQVDFERVVVLRGVSVRGNPQAAEWVRSFLLLFRSTAASAQGFRPYEEPYGSVMVFPGNTDNNTTVTTYLKGHVPTQHVQLQPQTWHGYIALQFDLLVCQTGCQEHGFIKDVSDEQLSATSSEAHYGPQTSRLQPGFSPPSTPGDAFGSGGWQAQFTRADQYIQVSLDVPVEIRAIATQGRHDSNYWVTSYTLTWSSDAKTWNNYTANGTTTVVLSGNSDEDTVRKHYLAPFLARYVRLHPRTWHGAVALRWELYGCPGKNAMRVLGCYTDHPEDRDLPYEPYTDPTDGMDPLLCSRHCFGKGYYYAGLQARDKCYCGNSYGRYGVSPDCNLKCFPQQQFICGGLTANFVYSTGLTSGFKVCPGGWTRLGGQCYGYSDTAKDWSSARAACGAQGAHLASVPDRNVDLLLYSLVGAAAVPSLTWIGLSDQRETRYYEWSNMEDVVYTDWDLHQPPPLVSGDPRHCVAINNQTGGWVVADCGRDLPCLCVTDLRPSDQPAETTAPKGCQQGMVAYTSSCYVVTEENRTKSDAADVCASFRGQLITVMNRFEQAYLTSLLSTRDGLYWTDVSDLYNPGRFTYSNGEHDVTFTNWAPNMPDSHRHGHCVAMGSGKAAGLWSSQDCHVALKAVCKLPRDGFPQPPVPPNKQQSTCPTNWITTNSSLCYQLNNVDRSLQMTWAEAREDCRQQRGDLASFRDTPLMEDFWRHKLLGSSNHFWIGLHALSNGELQWSDRTAVSLDGPWAAGQPDTNNGTQNCVELHVTSGTLALRDCSLPRNWLCALPQGVMPFQRLKDRLAPTAGPAGSCLPLDDTWKRYGDYCYKVSATAATWRQARASCQQSQADLASIANILENTFILSLAQKTFQQSVWIGLNELQSDAGYYGWSDGRSVSFVNWDGQGPDDANGEESCAELFVRTGKWNDNHCAVSQGYACKRYVSPVPLTTPTSPPPSGGGCPDGFLLFQTRCYLIAGQQSGKTWQDALADCKGRSTPFLRVTMASVRSHRENAFLTTHLLGTGLPVWVGLHLVDHNYLWVDNEELTYTNWDVGEPNGDQQDGCVHLYSAGANAGRWNDAACSRRMGWVCESNRFAYLPVPITIPGACPPGFLPLGGSCYLYNSTPLQWRAAEMACMSQGAHLVSVESQVEQDFVYLMVSANSSAQSSPHLWLGLSRGVTTSATGWSWTDGWPVTFTNWAPDGYPPPGISGRCVSMNLNGSWTDDDCLNRRPFVCKTTSDTPPFTPPAGRGACEGQGWSPVGDHCFAVYATDRVSFAHAAFQCSWSGASLASIHHISTNNFLHEKVKAVSALPVWIGFRRSDNDGFRWRDGSPVDFKNWNIHYPRGATDDGVPLYCALLSPLTGRWIDDECSAKNGYVCMKNKVYETSTATSQTSSSHGFTPTTKSMTSFPTPTMTSFPTPAMTSLPTHSSSSSLSTSSATTATATATATASVTASRQSALFSASTTMSTPRGPTHTGKEANKAARGGNSSSNGGAIAGGVVAGVVVVVLLIVGVVFLVRRYQHLSTAGFANVLYSGADDAVHMS